MAGQLRLASDCAQLELALEPVVGKLDSDVIGHSYSVSRSSIRDNTFLASEFLPLLKVLRSFRSLLFLRAEDVPASPLLSSGALPYSTALHFLFSKAPAELKSPHDSAGWSRSRYSAWLEEHLAEADRLQLIQGKNSLS